MSRRRAALRPGRARGDEAKRIGRCDEQACERRGRNQRVFDAVAVAVVGQRVRQVLQPVEPAGVDGQRRRKVERGVDQVVAERGDHCPDALAPVQMPVDQHSRAYAGRRVDVRDHTRGHRFVAREVMVEILHRRPGLREALEGGAVRVRRHVEHRDCVARVRVDAVEQRNVALGSRDEGRVAWVRETQLHDGADAVRVAVEDVVVHPRDDTTLRSYGAAMASETISAMSRTMMASASGMAFAASLIIVAQ